MKAAIRLLGLAAVAGVLAGCALPLYRPAPGTPMADVRLSPNMRNDAMTLCVDATCYTARPSQGHLEVPVGREVTLYRNFVAGGYQVTYSCYPGMRFRPQAATGYYADFEIRANRCGFWIFRLDPSSRAGIAFDPTARRIGS